MAMPHDRDRFRLLDALFMIAAMGIGVRVSVSLNDELGLIPPYEADPRGAVPEVRPVLVECRDWTTNSIHIATPCVYGLTIAVVVSGIVRLRRRWRRIGDCPGLATVGSAALLVPSLLACGLFRLEAPWNDYSSGVSAAVAVNDWAEAVAIAPVWMGACIAAAWLPFAVRGRGLRVQGWTDTVALVLAAYWVVTGAFLLVADNTL